MTTAAPHFVLQSLPRSGSIMLGRLLDQHPQLRCFGEIFSIKPVHLAEPIAAGAPRDPAGRLAHFAARAAPRRWGFRAHVYHGTPGYDPDHFGDFWPALGASRVIHLLRRNLLHRCVSHRVAHLTDQWFVRTGEEASLRRVTVRLCAREVAEDCETMASWQAVGNARFPAAYRVFYEDMLIDLPGTLRALLSHLEVDGAVGLAPATMRMSRSMRETVENYDELKRHFQGSRWQRFFDE